MERLTYWCDDGMGGGKYHVNENGTEYSGPSIDRLAAYEDTGLTPEGMEAIKTSLMGKSLAEIKEINGLPVERMIDLAEAEHEGRLVVLPCAPGAEVWVVERDEDGCAVDVSGYMFLAKAGDAVILTAYINDLDNAQDILAYHMQETAKNYDTDLVVFHADDCYTTCEEAEAALKQEVRTSK